MGPDDEDPGGQLPGPSDNADDLSQPDGTSGDAGQASDFASQFADVVRDFGSTGLTDANEIRRQELHAAAVHYWELGMRVIPLHSYEGGRCSCGNEECQSPGKHPVQAKWQEPHLDPEADRRWWRELAVDEITPVDWSPLAGIGVLTGGHSGIFVVDLDEGGDLKLGQLEAEHPGEPVPATMLVQTGRGGRHHYFRHPGWPVANRKPWGKDAHIDIKGDGGFVVAPPSVSGFGPYLFIQDITSANQLASAPSWVLDVLRREYDLDNGEATEQDLPAVPDDQLRHYVEAAIEGNAAAMRDAPETDRNNTLNRLAFRLGTIGAHGLITQAEAWDALSDAAQAAGLGAREIRLTFNSGWYSGLLRPADLSSVGGGEHEWQRFTRDDFGLGDRLVQYFGAQLRYVEERESWYTYAGGTWRRCTQAEPERLAQEMLRKLPALEGDLYPSEKAEGQESSPRDSFLAWVRRHRNRASIRTAMLIARDRPAIRLPAELFDQSPFMINLKNGVYDGETGEFTRGHDASQLLTMMGGAAYDPRAGCPLWDEFMARVQPDEEWRAFLYRCWGYSLTSDLGERPFFLHNGPTATGKSVMNNVISHICGSYSQTMPVESLLLTGNTGSVPTDIARMVGKRYMSASETRAGRLLNEALVKQLTGGDTMAARFMRQDFFEFKPSGKIHLISNHRIGLSNDSATQDRIHIIPWEVSVPRPDRDKRLASRIIRAEASGVLNRLLAGLADWQDRGSLAPPQQAEEHKTKILAEEDWRLGYKAACCKEIPRQKCAVGTSTPEHYVTAFTPWWRMVYPGTKVPSMTTFSQLMGEMFEIAEGKTRDRKHWRGFTTLQVLPFDEQTL